MTLKEDQSKVRRLYSELLDYAEALAHGDPPPLPGDQVLWQRLEEELSSATYRDLERQVVHLVQTAIHLGQAIEQEERST